MTEALPVDPEKLEGSVDPLTFAIFIFLLVGAYQALTGWREDWACRTTLGKCGLVLAAPLRVALALLAMVVAAGLGVLLTLEFVVFSGPRLLYGAYKRRAFKEVPADD